MKKADLHCHSTFSDGEFTLDKLFLMAKEKDLSYLAITDHDNIKSFDNTLFTSGVKQIYGFELSTQYNGDTVHILSYYKDKNQLAPELRDFLDGAREKRYNRAKAYIDNLNFYYGLHLDFNEIKHVYNITRPEICTLIMKEKNLSRSEVFNSYLSDKSVAYIPAIVLDSIAGIKLLKSANVVSIAHPCLMKRETFLLLYKNAKFDAIEAIYPRNTKEDEAFFKKFALDHNLLITAGSDFHMLHDETHGKIGDCTISDENLDKFLELLNK